MGDTAVSADSITRVGVVGAGQMGAGIAEVSVRAGVDVKIFETTEALVDGGPRPDHQVAGAWRQHGQGHRSRAR